jgi:UDP-glucose 4-epimerase
MRVLVTGGAGFIGGNLVHALVADGHRVAVIDDLSTGTTANLHPAARFRQVGILEPGMAIAMAEFAPEVVVHLAAQTDVQRSIADPERDRAVNVEGTAAVARAAAESGARRVISASSAAVYGDPESLPLSESAAKRPMNPYGASKLAGESALAAALAGTGVDFASMRFANVYGPGQDWRGEGGVVAIVSSRLAKGESPVIFGDGTQTRDFIFVGDVVAFILKAIVADTPLAGEMPDGPAYNVSTGTQIGVARLAELLAEVSGVRVPIEYREARQGDILHSALDPAKAAAALGWRATEPLDAGLRATWRWLSANL